MTWDFGGETAIVNGAARGIGRATAERLGEEGAAVALADRDVETLAETADDLEVQGIDVEAVEYDVSVLDDVEALVERTVERFGGLDVLVNNAGIGSQAPVHELDPDDW